MNTWSDCLVTGFAPAKSAGSIASDLLTSAYYNTVGVLLRICTIHGGGRRGQRYESYEDSRANPITHKPNGNGMGKNA